MMFSKYCHGTLLRVAVVPDLGLAQERKSRHMDNPRPAELVISCKEDCVAEDPLERSNQASIFLTAFLNSERVKHFGAALEANRLALLLDSQSREKYWYDTTLAEREAIIGMPSDLQNQMSVAAFEQKLTRRRATNWQATKNERARTKSEILLLLFPVLRQYPAPLS